MTVADTDGVRKLYVALTRAMHSLTITLPRFVRFTGLENFLPTYAPTFSPELAEALVSRTIVVEADPS